MSSPLSWWNRLRQPDVERPGWEAEQVRHAYNEWQAMERYFQEVTEPALVDHAVYLMKAAEEKYRHCLTAVRNPGA